MSVPAALSPSVERPTMLRHYVLAALLVITAINYVQRNSISPLQTTIEDSLRLSARQVDWITGAFFWSYTLFQVPSGWLAKRWGSRLTLPLYATGWSLALLACALATGFFGLFLGRLAMGVLQAGIFPCATLILSVWFPSSLRGVATALLNSCMLFGSAGGATLTAYLIVPLSWQQIFVAYAIPGVVWSVWFLWWFRNHPSEHPGVNQAERDLLPRPAADAPRAGVPASAAWVAVLTSVPLLLLCTQQSFRAAANRLFDSRLPTYLEQQRLSRDEADVPDATGGGELLRRAVMLDAALAAVGGPWVPAPAKLQAWAVEEAYQQAVTRAVRQRAGLLASYPQWFGVFGGICGGALSDLILFTTRNRRLARNGVAIASLLLATLIYLAAYFIADVTWAVMVAGVGLFVFSFSSPCAYSLCIDIGGKYLAFAFGLMNMLGNLGAAVFVSSVMTLVGVGGWPFALGVWLSLHLAAVVCWLFLNPNRVVGEPQPEKVS